MCEYRATRLDLMASGHLLDSHELAAASRKAHLAVSPETGQLLYALVRAARPLTVVEFGTSFGISTLHLAAALRDNEVRRLVTTELEPTKAEAAQKTLVEAGLDDLVEILVGDARETLALHPPRAIDFLFLDGSKCLYIPLLERLDATLTVGALVVADNADVPGYREYLEAHPDRFARDSSDDRVEVTVVRGRA